MTMVQSYAGEQNLKASNRVKKPVISKKIKKNLVVRKRSTTISDRGIIDYNSFHLVS